MRLICILAALIVLLSAETALAAAAPGLAAAVTDNEIDVTSDFRGARVTVFGATPDRTSRRRAKGDIVVALRGPDSVATVFRKRRMFGLWIKADPVRFTRTPYLFAVAATRPVAQIIPAREIGRLALDPALVAQPANDPPADGEILAYRSALARLKHERGLYKEATHSFKLLRGGLFQANFDLPANAPTGAYTAEVYYFREGRLIATEKSPVTVSQQGIERTVHDFSSDRPRLYGLSCICLAVGVGWFGALLTRRA